MILAAEYTCFEFRKMMIYERIKELLFTCFNESSIHGLPLIVRNQRLFIERYCKNNYCVKIPPSIASILMENKNNLKTLLVILCHVLYIIHHVHMFRTMVSFREQSNCIVFGKKSSKLEISNSWHYHMFQLYWSRHGEYNCWTVTKKSKCFLYVRYELTRKKKFLVRGISAEMIQNSDIMKNLFRL